MPLTDDLNMDPLSNAGDPDVARAYYKNPRRTVIQLSQESGLDVEDIAYLAGVPVADVQAYASKIPPAALRPKSQGELRARRPGFGYFIEDLTGSLRAGQIADKIIDFGAAPAKAQIGMAQEGGENIAAGLMERNPLRFAGGAVQTGLSALPLSSKLSAAAYSTLPRAAGSSLALATAPILGAGMLSKTSEAQEAAGPAQTSSNVLKQLYEQRTSINRQREFAVEERDAQLKGKGGRAKGRGPIYEKKDKEVQRLTDELGAMDKLIADERYRGTPEYKLELARKQREADAEEKRQRAATPTRELYPEIVSKIPLITGSAAVVLGGALRARAISNYNKQISELTKRWLGVVTRANTAVNKGNTTTAERLAKTAEGLKTNFDKLVAKGPGGTKDSLIAGAGLGLAGTFAPEEWDFGRAAMGQPLWQSLKENLLDNWGDTLKRAGMGIALGSGMGHLGALGVKPLVSRPQPVGYGPETEALTNGLRQLQLPSSSASAQLQIITKSRAGYHGPDGKFIRPPKKGN